jgi:outer membrane protein TolC
MVFLAVVVGQTATDKLTLEHALSIAMKNAFTLRIAESKAEKARKQEKAARGAFGPTVTAQGSYSRFDGSVTGNTGSSGGSSGGGGGSTSFTGDSKTASLTLNQPIDISGISRKALEATEFTRKAAEAGLGVEVNNLKLTVRGAFYNVLLTKALVKVQQDAVSAAQARLDKAIIREREGAIPKFDVLRFQNEVRKSEQSLSQAVGTFENAKHALNSALARPIETDFDAVPVDELPAVPDNPSDLVVVALRNRAEVKQSEFTITALNRTADVQGASMKPQLNVQATHTRNIDPGPGQQNFGSFESIVLSFPLFDSGIARARVDAARRDEDQARIGLEQLLLGIALEVRNALTLAQTAKKTYEVALDSESLAAEALRLAEIRYAEGAGILIDVTQAQADLTAARGNVQNAKYQFLNAYAALLKAIGKDDLTITELQ